MKDVEKIGLDRGTDNSGEARPCGENSLLGMLIQPACLTVSWLSEFLGFLGAGWRIHVSGEGLKA